MPYKDPEKQRTFKREWARKHYVKKVDVERTRLDAVIKLVFYYLDHTAVGKEYNEALREVLHAADPTLPLPSGPTEEEATLERGQIQGENYEDKLASHPKFKGCNRSLNLPVVPRALNGPFVPNALTENIKQFELKVTHQEKKKE
jgi:hypothetical protein